jgi:Fe-S cluster assembly protein SufD
MMQASLDRTRRASQPSHTAALADLLKLRGDLATDLPAAILAQLTQVRDRAAAVVQELAIPSTNEENWRFTDLSPLCQQHFQLQPEAITLDSSALAEIETAKADAAYLLVFANGRYAPELSRLGRLPEGVIVGNLQQLSSMPAKVADSLAKQPGAEEVFTALNTASFVDTAVIWIPQHQQVPAPIHLLFVGTGAAVCQPRCLVVAANGSSLTLVEEYVSSDPVDPTQDDAGLTNAVTEIWLEANAQVEHIRVQREQEATFHIGKTAVSQARDSQYTCHAISSGARISRHNLDVHLTGEQTSTHLNGLTLAMGEQLADTHSAIAFSQPYCRSRQLHKCIVGDRARAVFNGKVSVPKAAQLTDAGQLSRNLLLSPKARIDTKPELEIVADNVKCSHGATVSQLDAEEIFYLQSRGLDPQQASDLLVTAFAVELLDAIPVPAVRRLLTAQILARIHP